MTQLFFFFNDTATTEIYTLSLHDALPIYLDGQLRAHARDHFIHALGDRLGDRKSTRLNSSHLVISYAVFCLKKKKKNDLLVYTKLVYIPQQDASHLYIVQQSHDTPIHPRF